MRPDWIPNPQHIAQHIGFSMCCDSTLMCCGVLYEQHGLHIECAVEPYVLCNVLCKKASSINDLLAPTAEQHFNIKNKEMYKMRKRKRYIAGVTRARRDVLRAVGKRRWAAGAVGSAAS